MRKLILTIFIITVFTSKTFTQNVDLVCYDCRRNEIQIIPFPTSPEIQEDKFTSWNLSEFDEIAQLAQTKPQNTMSHSGFTEIVPAQTVYNVTDFPLRTVANLFEFEDEVQRKTGTGTMVGSRFMITAAHVVYDRQNSCFKDSILVAPAYDDSTINSEFGTGMSKRYYILQTFYNNTNSFSDDIALIELAEPIGDKTGWIGLAWADDDELYENRVLHQFGYPGKGKAPFTGETMYYGYGSLDIVEDYFGIGYYGAANGGQSGSSLILSDNSSWYSVGILHGVTDLGESNGDITFHAPITQNKFLAFKNIIENATTSTSSPQGEQISTFELKQNYPNPFNSTTVIQFSLGCPEHVTLKIYNINGQRVGTLVNGERSAGTYRFQWRANALPGGIYFARLQTGMHSQIIKLVFQK